MYDEPFVSTARLILIHFLTFHSTYKGSKIEWDSDECAALLERPRQNFEENSLPKKKKEAQLTNRFQLLNMDEEDGSEEDDDLDTSSIAIATSMSAGILA